MTGKLCSWKSTSTDRTTGKSGLSEECLVGLYLKEVRGITDKRIIRAFTNTVVLAEHLIEAKEKVKECSVRHHHDCPIEKYLPME